MYDNIKSAERCLVCPVNAGLVVCRNLMLAMLLPWNAYANAEEFATLHIGEPADVSIAVDGQSLGVEKLNTTAIVASTDTGLKPVHIAPVLPDAAPLDASKRDQYAQLDVAASQEVRSLDVVDTGASVEFPNAVGELGGGIEDQKANVDPSAQPVTGSSVMIDQGGQLEADSNGMLEQGDQSLVTGTSVMLPATHTADAYSQAGDAGGEPKGVVNDAAVSEESAGLPYAVVLALLALIGLGPVARRNDRHHV